MEQNPFNTGRLIGVGPLTTSPGNPVAVETVESLRVDQQLCTCAYCRRLGTQNQILGEPERESDTPSVHHIRL
jgi:hypothetical protein